MATFRDKENIIKNFAKEYKKSKIIELKGLDLLKEDSISENYSEYMDTKNKYTYYYSLQSRIDNVLDKLDWEESDFLRKEFFNNNIYNNWWMNYYSRSTYYRIKKKCMQKFLELLYA